MTEVELAWLAGLLEGEGCFHWIPSRYSENNGCGVISLYMTDIDIVERAAILMEASAKIMYNLPKKSNHKTCYYITISGYAAIRIMTKVLPYMGKRRSEKIIEITKLWHSRPRQQRETGLPTECHPDRKHYAKGKCIICYKSYTGKLWYKRKKEKEMQLNA